MEGLNSRNCLGVEVRGEQRLEKQRSGGKWEGTKGETRGAQRSERRMSDGKQGKVRKAGIIWAGSEWKAEVRWETEERWMSRGC